MDLSNGWRALARLGHHGRRFGPVGFVGRAGLHGQERALAVDGHMARAAFDLLAAVEAAFLAFRRRLHALAVQDGVARSTTCAAKLLHAPARAQHGDRLLPCLALLPALPVVKNRVVRRKIMGQRAPAATLIRARLNHAPLGVLLVRPTWIGPCKERLDPRPLLIAQGTWTAHPGNLPAPRPTNNTLTPQVPIITKEKRGGRDKESAFARKKFSSGQRQAGKPLSIGGRAETRSLQRKSSRRTEVQRPTLSG